MPITRKVKKGQTILYQGEVPSSIFVIRKGLIRGLNISSNGEERTISLYGKGDYFPVGVAHKKTLVAILYYESMTDSILELYGLDDFYAKLSKPTAEDMARMAGHWVGANLQINALTHTLAHDRVCHIIHYLCLRFGLSTKIEDEVKIGLPLTQLDIANLAGLTRETTAIEIGKLKKLGIIKANKRFYTVRLKKLLKAMNNEEFEDITL